MKRLFRLANAILIVALCVCTAGGRAPASSPSEYEIKAAFLYNFANYIEWPTHVPADSGGTFVIGVYGDDPFQNTLDRAVSDKTINGRKIEIKHFRSSRDLKPCHILFISASEKGRTDRILNAVKDWHTLTVGETDGFARNGGIIGFFLEDKRVRFEINVKDARKAGLKVSSKLMKLARVVNA